MKLPALLLTGALVLCASLSTATAQSGGTALSAIKALPVSYQDDIVKVSADNGTPNPPKWYILAMRDDGDGPLKSFTVANGQVLDEKVSLNISAMLRSSKPVSLMKVTVDSPAAFAIAQRYAANSGKTLGSVSYALTQRGRSAAPFWAIWCYDKAGGYLGYLEILATDGTVVSNDGFARMP